MPKVPIEDLGSVGIIVDLAPHDVPPEGFSAGQNIRFEDGAVKKMPGQDFVYNTRTPLSVPEVLQTHIPTGIVNNDYPARTSMDGPGEHLIIGSPWKTSNGLTEAGMAFVYDIEDGVLQNERLLIRSLEGAYESFGGLVAASGDGNTYLVGARKATDSSGTISEAGAVYIFVRDLDTGVLTEQARLESPAPQAGAKFGFSGVITYDGDAVVIGEPYWDSGSYTDLGRAHAFERDIAGNWSLSQTINIFGPSSDNQCFAANIGMSQRAERVAFGCHEYGTEARRRKGRVQILRTTRDANDNIIWTATPTETLVASDEETDAFFGLSIDGGSPSVYADNLIGTSKFDLTINPWIDASVGTGSISHDSSNMRMNLNHGGVGNEGIARDSFTVLPSQEYRFTIAVGATDVRLKVGSTVGGTENNTTILGATAPEALVVFTTDAAQTTVYIQLESISGNSSVDNVELRPLVYQGLWSGNSLKFSKTGTRLLVGANGHSGGHVVNEDFSVDIGNFTAEGGASIALDTNRLKVTGSSSPTICAQRVVYAIAGRFTRIYFDLIQGDTANNIIVRLGTTPGGAEKGQVTSSSSGTFVIPFTPSGGFNTLYLTAHLSGGSGANYFFLDNILAESRYKGQAYVFDESGSLFSETEILRGTEQWGDDEYFGWSIALSGDGNTALIGGYGWYNDTILAAGKAYLLTDSGSGFVETAQIIAPGTVDNLTGFGYDVTLDEDAFIGAVTALIDDVTNYGKSKTYLWKLAEWVAPIAPHYLQPWRTTTEYRWIYAGVAGAYYTNGIADSDITRYTTTPGDDDYTAGSRPLWTGDVFNGVPILNHNNLTDPPQQWDVSIGRLKNLTNWPASTYCKVIRAWKSFLVALDITESGVRNPFKVLWSDSADPGTVPGTWVASPTNLAGSQPLAQTDGWLVDCLPLGDINVIYKQDSIWSMSFIGGVQVMQFRELNSTIGALAPRCIQEFYRNHLVVGTNDIVLFNGSRPQSIINQKMRRWFFNNLHPDYTDYTIICPNYVRREMMICFVEDSAPSNYLTKALVWNWDQGTWTVRDLPDVSFLASGKVAGGQLTFDQVTGAFDDNNGVIGGAGTTPAQDQVVMAKAYGDSILLETDKTYENMGNDYLSYVERTGLAIAGVDRYGKPYVDPSKVKILRAIYLKVLAQRPVTLRVYAGAQESPSGPVYWEGPYTFNSATDTKVDFTVSGKYLAWRVEEDGHTPWEITGGILDVDVIASF